MRLCSSSLCILNYNSFAMIQRIQTLWLLLAAAAAFLVLQLPFYSGNMPKDGAITFNQLTARSGDLLPLVTCVATGLLSLVTIFLFKNRKQQISFTVITLLVSVGSIVLYYLEIKHFTEGNYALTAIFPLLVPIFLFLAARGIRKDQKLVKSLDRLR